MTTETNTHKREPGYALEAILQDLHKWRSAGSDHLHFGTLSSHPETNEGCTVGNLIIPAIEEYADLRQKLAAAEKELRAALAKSEGRAD